MKPFAFSFLQTPVAPAVDFSLIEYDDQLNLNVDKATRQPAVEYLKEGTETFTRQNETADSDNNTIQTLVGTETCTKVQGESSDDDFTGVKMLMETETITFVDAEASDSDDDTRKLYLFT